MAADLVVDASVSAKWYLTDEDLADRAALLLRRYLDGELLLYAPDYIRYESASVFIAATLGASARIVPGRAHAYTTAFLATGIVMIADDALILEAQVLAHQHRCAIYDALYLALAERLGISLITADRRFYYRVAHLPYVLWLGDYA